MAEHLSAGLVCKGEGGDLHALGNGGGQLQRIAAVGGGKDVAGHESRLLDCVVHRYYGVRIDFCLIDGEFHLKDLPFFIINKPPTQFSCVGVQINNYRTVPPEIFAQKYGE